MKNNLNVNCLCVFCCGIRTMVGLHGLYSVISDCFETLVYDLAMKPGIVSSRVALLPRSTEIKPMVFGFFLFW